MKILIIFGLSIGLVGLVIAWITTRGMKETVDPKDIFGPPIG